MIDNLDKTTIRHIKASIDALDKAMQPLSVNYHLYEAYQINSAHGDWEKYKRFQAARDYWEDLLED